MASRLMLTFEAVSSKLMSDDGRKLELSLGHRLSLFVAKTAMR